MRPAILMVIATIVGLLALASAPAMAQCGGSTSEEIAETIARGHAYRKHVEGIGNGDVGREFEAGRVIARLAFPPPSVERPEQFAALLRRVIETAENEPLQRDRRKFWDRRTGTVVIVDGKSRDCGTAFRPNAGRNYYDRLR